MIKSLLSALVLLSFSILNGMAQQSVNSTGVTTTSNTGNLSYSVGQVFTNFNSNLSGSVSQGVQQPQFVISTDVNNIANSISVFVFPNPTSDILNFTIVDKNLDGYKYKFYDITGKMLFEGDVNKSTSSIGLSGLSASLYFLKLFHNNQPIQVFKISKT